ncbi:hypothetical protein LCGC14_0923580 [marine sediment metagenome]|uniref:Uncharacterized protein n=1 Tax=marine sediment metagenome TaxID=412755 RepID=A0A0F9R8S5_9ZZZZ
MSDNLRAQLMQARKEEVVSTFTAFEEWLIASVEKARKLAEEAHFTGENMVQYLLLFDVWHRLIELKVEHLGEELQS